LSRVAEGADLVWFTEHHFVDDGYLPSWTPVAGAMASVTERVRFGTDICLLPFNHPVRLAEDLAVLDNLSGGRVELGVGIILSVLVTDDRSTDWPLVRAAEKYRMALYQRFFDESGEGFGDPADAIPQTWIVGDVQHCVDELKRFIDAFGITDIVTMAVPPGLRAEQMSTSLEGLFKEVVPRVKAQMQA